MRKLLRLLVLVLATAVVSWEPAKAARAEECQEGGTNCPNYCRSYCEFYELGYEASCCCYDPGEEDGDCACVCEGEPDTCDEPDCQVTSN